MSTDVNDFDSWLKARLYRDLVFRILIWFCISFATGLLAIFYFRVSPAEYLDRIANTLGPLVNSIGTASILLCVLAMMLKDLEETVKNPELVSATRGHLGGFVRRAAGDLSLWTLGAFTTLFSTLALVVFLVDISLNEYFVVGNVAFLLATFIACIGGANMLVRRKAPTPLLNLFRNPKGIAGIYITSLATLIGWLLAQPLAQ